MHKVETARKVLGIVGVLELVWVLGFLSIIIGSSKLNPNVLDLQLKILTVGALSFAVLFFGLLYYFSCRCHLVTANELITGQYRKKIQNIIQTASHAPDPVDRSGIMLRIRREFRLTFLNKMQDQKLQKR